VVSKKVKEHGLKGLNHASPNISLLGCRRGGGRRVDSTMSTMMYNKVQTHARRADP
jgi:hypothetical protein